MWFCSFHEWREKRAVYPPGVQGRVEFVCSSDTAPLLLHDQPVCHMKFPWSKPPPPPPPPPPLIDSTFAAIATVVVVLLAILATRKKKAKPLRRPQALASAALLRAQLSDPALLVEFDDAEYRSVRDGADWTDLKAVLKPRKTLDTVRPWSVGTHGTETWNVD